MKKNSLTTAIIAGVAGVAGLAGVAQAVNLNPDGIGQVLLYPYYTTNGGNTTLFTVVNTADVGKAVKVRFLESLNSKEVLDFNVYMSPFDVWTAAIYDNAGTPGISTEDKTCIAPNSVMTSFTPFRDYEFAYWRPDLLGVGVPPDADAKNASRMQQGHVEVIEMGDLGGLPYENSLHGLHGGVWQPKDCSYFEKEWTQKRAVPTPPLTWLEETGGDTSTPNFNIGIHDVYPPGSGYMTAAGPEFHDVGGVGGIFGGAYIVNAAEGTAYSYNAEAINGFFSISDAVTGNVQDSNLHFAPGTVAPRLTDAANEWDGLDTWAVARVFDAAGNPSDLAFRRGDSPEAVSAVLMARYVANEYAINGVSEAISDWVVTFPTKEIHTYRKPAGSTAAAGLAPFSVAQGAGANGDEQDNEFAGSWPEVFSMAYWDREELEPTTPPGVLDVSPLPPPGEVQKLSFRQEANVLSFYTKGDTPVTVLQAPEGVYGGGYAVALEAAFSEGWARIGFDTQSMSSTAETINGTTYPAVTLSGLPVIGFWAARHTNYGAAPGISAYYNIIHRHRVTRDIQ